MYASTVFDLTGTYNGGAGTLFGNVTIDTIAGTVVSADVSASGTLTYSHFTFDAAKSSQILGTLYSLVANNSGVLTPNINIRIPVATLVGYAGGNLCAAGAFCSGSSSNVNYGPGAPGAYNFSNGSALTAQSAATPEPTSVVLVGSAMLALLGLRRRF